MCVSALVENDLERIAAKLGVPHLTLAATPANASLPRRIEARDPALVVRQSTAGRFVAEPMAFNPYVLRRSSLGGDMWAEHMLATRHGIVLLKGFSEWVSLGLLVGHGLIPVHEAHCAFNRFAAPNQRFSGRADDRLVLANFNPASGGSLLVPVLFDVRRDPPADETQPVRYEFAVVSDEPSGQRHFGAGHAPVCLTLEAALEWLCIESVGDEEGEADARVDWDEILGETKTEPLAFGLFKSA